jgi:hypothetical protein
MTAPTPAKSIRYGVDCSWGRPDPIALREADKSFVVRYVSWDLRTDASGVTKNLTRAEAELYAWHGIDVVTVWENRAADVPNAADPYKLGAYHARAARFQGLQVGMPSWKPIYFAVDFDPRPLPGNEHNNAAARAYLEGIRTEFDADACGPYGAKWIVGWALDNGFRYAWQTAAWSKNAAGVVEWDTRASMRQTLNNQTVAGAKVDLDTAYDDPGFWYPGQQG